MTPEKHSIPHNPSKALSTGAVYATDPGDSMQGGFSQSDKRRGETSHHNLAVMSKVTLLFLVIWPLGHAFCAVRLECWSYENKVLQS